MPIYPVYWQLEYPGGLLRTEPPEGETILHAPKRYIALRLIDLVGRPVQRVEIPSGYRPILYRIRSTEVVTSGAQRPVQGDIKLDYTVFGLGTDPEYLKYGQQGSVTLWAWHGGKAVDLPPRLMREGSIKHLLESPVGV